MIGSGTGGGGNRLFAKQFHFIFAIVYLVFDSNRKSLFSFVFFPNKYSNEAVQNSKTEILVEQMQWDTGFIIWK